VEGTITEDRDQLELLKKIKDADHVAALLVFVNSPGGTTTGGEALFEALREIAKKKPVVAQFGTIAASAGYIVGLGADHIVSRANTITGSVGVLIQWPEVSQMLDKIGVKVNEIKSGDLKAVPSPFEPLSEEGQKVTRSMIDEGFAWFLSLVEQRRGVKPDAIPGLNRGRVFTGREALSLKLVDAIGGEDAAVDWLRKTRNIDNNLKVVDWKPEDAASYGLFKSLSSAAAGVFGRTYLGQMLARDPSLSTLGLDGLVSVWHPSEN
jgi:protease-4